MKIVLIVTSLLACVPLILGTFLLAKHEKASAQKNHLRSIMSLISEGLDTFTRRALTTILQVVIYFILLSLGLAWVLEYSIVWPQLLSFAAGALFMTLFTFLGLRSIPRLAPKILELSGGFFSEGLQVLYDTSKAVLFLLSGGMVLLLMLCIQLLGLESIVGFGFGVTLTAFFLRVGGGVFESSAELSQVSTYHQSIPNDQRNPAVLLNVIGSYIGELIGYGSDILSSYLFAIISAVISGGFSVDYAAELSALPLMILAANIIVAILGYFYGKVRQKYGFNNLLLEGVYFSIILNVLLVFAIHHVVFSQIKLNSFYAYFLGAVGAIVIALMSEYLTNVKYGPTRKIVTEIELGTLFPLLNSLSSGLRVNGVFLVVSTCIVLIALYFSGVYGLSIAAMGLLSASFSVSAAKVFSGFTESLSKIGRFHFDESDLIRKNMVGYIDLGRTMSAIGNGFSVATSVISTITLFSCLLLFSNVNLTTLALFDPNLILGIVGGLVLAYVFLGTLLKGYLRTLLKTVSEVLRQFRDIPYLTEGKAYPDIIKASHLHTIESLRSLTLPGLFLVLVPLILGYVSGEKALVGLTLGAIIMGSTQGYFWANVGDVLHSAHYHLIRGNYGGESSPAYPNILNANNVGNTYHKVLGPSANMLIKGVVIVAIFVMVLVL